MLASKQNILYLQSLYTQGKRRDGIKRHYKVTIIEEAANIIRSLPNVTDVCLYENGDLEIFQNGETFGQHKEVLRSKM